MPAASKRDVCVWLGTLASWRSGLVKRLVRTFGSVEEVVAQSPRALTQAVGQRASVGRHTCCPLIRALPPRRCALLSVYPLPIR